MHETRTEWAPSVPRGRWCSSGCAAFRSRHPPLSSDQSLTSAGSYIPYTRTFKMTRHQPRVHSRSPARPSPRPWPPEGTRTLRLEPWAPHPAVTRDARQGGDRPSSTSRGSRHHQGTSSAVIHSPHATSCRTRRVLPSTASTVRSSPRGRAWSARGRRRRSRRANTQPVSACCSAAGSTAASTRPNVVACGVDPHTATACSACAAHWAIAAYERAPASTAPTASSRINCRL
jgi:hypothetical protein